jgi:LPS-assembly protein
MNWEVSQERYFDPTFGGALIPGQPNILSVTEDATPYTFLTRPRNYSPVNSILRFNLPFKTGLDWRLDYDPLLHRLTNQNIDASYSVTKLTVASVGYRVLSPDPLVLGYPDDAAEAGRYLRQISLGLRYGNSLRKGWNFGATAFYDVNLDQLDFLFSQVTYNTDCCGFNFEARRLAFGLRNENQFLFSFVLANIGTFGNFRRQDRIF